MIDDFYSNASCLWLREWAGDITIQTFPCFFINLCFQRTFQVFIWIIRPKKIGMTDKEALFVIVGINEPGRYTVTVTRDDFSF